MPTINRITNVNNLIEKKVNYFLDQLYHFVNYAGWQSQLEMETPTSIIEKILFRLSEETKIRLEYLDNYFKDSFFSTETIWDKYETYYPVKEVVTKYNLLGKNQKQEKYALVDSSKFQSNLKILLRDLTHKMPEDLINAILNNVLCPHDLNDKVPNTSITHSNSFDSYALILASEYFFRGYTKSEIREIINNVFSKDERLFPFPPNIRTKRQRQNYLNDRKLENQLHGFSNAFKLRLSQGTIMVKVFGGSFPSDFEFRYDKVKFYGKTHQFVEKIKSKMTTSDAEDFFNDGDYILASTKVDWLTQESLLNKVKRSVRSELVFMSAILDRDFSVDNTQNYIRLGRNMEYKGSAWSTRKFNNPFAHNALERLNENGYQDLRRIKGQAVNWFLNYEPLFVNAHRNESVADYWLYLETLLSFNRNEKTIKTLVSTIVLTNEEFVRNRRVLTTLRDCFLPFNGGLRLLGVSGDQWKPICKELEKGRIPKEVRRMEYPFIQKLIKEYDLKLSAEYYKEVKEKYYRILTEAYEYRNSFVHKGITNDKSRIKLVVTIPYIVMRVRWAFFKALKSGDENLPFDLFVNNVAKEGEALLHKAQS